MGSRFTVLYLWPILTIAGRRRLLCAGSNAPTVQVARRRLAIVLEGVALVGREKSPVRSAGDSVSDSDEANPPSPATFAALPFRPPRLRGGSEGDDDNTPAE